MNPLALPTFLLAMGLFWLGIQAERRLKRKTRTFVSIVAVILSMPCLLYAFYYAHFFDNAAWFYNFRAIGYTELLASGVGLIGGFLYSLTDPESVGEKSAIPTVLFILLAIPFIKPVITPLDYEQLRVSCDGEVCLQSTPSTCGPTSAANILKSFGQPASEKQLAIEAYTYRGGTENWYLSRALRSRGFDTKVFVDSTLPPELPAPSIAGVVLAGGAGHFIALLSQEGNDVTLVDPLVGKLVIPRASLEKQYRFTGFFLVVKERSTR